MYKYAHTQSHTLQVWKETYSTIINANDGEENGRDPLSFSINNYFLKIFYNVRALKCYFSKNQTFKISISEDYKVSTKDCLFLKCVTQGQSHRTGQMTELSLLSLPLLLLLEGKASIQKFIRTQ